MAMASNLVAMASNLVVMASNLVAMASNLVAMASNLVAMASNLVVMASNLVVMASNLVVIASNLVVIASNLINGDGYFGNMESITLVMWGPDSFDQPSHMKFIEACKFRDLKDSKRFVSQKLELEGPDPE